MTQYGHVFDILLQMMGEEAYVDDFVKVAVLADPQLMDKTSLGLAPKSLALEIVQFYTDLYMRRSYLASILPFKPDVILFLGDYFDGGPVLSDEE
ncbi:metallophosphoesterase 1 homolog [Telopea speciosissima]|uniref:metallophosphoesterase 1 homolog n=1 Tax=Telopea speciosissima TaxID=54955 RepID=UPI001CC75EDD|nr:metallophosphoesterase 1 homolog [Telopea speciosissima]